MRFETLDVVRGLAILGILVMNIANFGLPASAYFSPLAGGGLDPLNVGLFQFNMLFFDGKMRALFTLLFGAAIVLFGLRDEGEGAARRHVARMAVLFLIGMVHAWLIWSGDILVLYAAAGMLLYPWRNRTPSGLFFAAVLALALQAALSFQIGAGARSAEIVASSPAATVADKARWQKYHEITAGNAETIARDTELLRGNWAEVQQKRSRSAWASQTYLLPIIYSFETIGLMLIGMALVHLSWWQGEFSKQHYRRFAVFGLSLALGANLLMVWLYVRSGYSAPWYFWTESVRIIVGPVIALGYAALLILWVKSGGLDWLRKRLMAAGRLTLSNYLGTSLLMTTLFYGTGFGLFAKLDRMMLWLVVLLAWVLMLGWSAIWLRNFYFGPAEWLWRSLSSGKWLPLKRPQSVALKEAPYDRGG